MNVSDFTAMGLVGLDVKTTMRVPEADRTVLAAAQAVISVSVEPRREYCSFVTFQHVRLLPWKLRRAHLLSLSLFLSPVRFFFFCRLLVLFRGGNPPLERNLGKKSSWGS